MKNLLVLFITPALLTTMLFAQAPYIHWQRCYGGSGEDFDGLNSLIITSDSGYFLTGTTFSSDGDVSGYHSGWVNGYQTGDGWVLKLDSLGNIQWQRALGGTFSEQLNASVNTADGGYLAVGYTTSVDGDVSGVHGSNCSAGYCGDGWVVKLDSQGNIQWQKCYGGSETEFFYSITTTPQGNYLLAGITDSNDGDVSGNHAPPGIPTDDIWLVEIDSVGNIVRQKCYGGWGKETIEEVRFVSPDKYLIIGGSNSIDGDVSGLHGLHMDIWVFCINLTGQLLWQKCIGGPEIDYAGAIANLNNGKYLVTGTLPPENNYDLSCRIDTEYSSVPLVMLDDTGRVVTSKCLGGSYSESGKQILQYDSLRILVAATSGSVDGDVVGNHGSLLFGTFDYWVVCLDTSLNLMWSQCYGGSSDDYANIMLKTSDGGLIISGSVSSNDGDISGNHGGSYDISLLKLYLPSEYEAKVLTQPVGSYCTLTDSEQVKLQIINLGQLAFRSFPVSYSINGNNPITEMITDTLEPGDTLLYTFQAHADFSIPGNYTLTTSVSIAGDAHAFNDSSTVEVISINHIGIPMSMGFEDHEVFEGYSSIDLDGDGRSGAIGLYYPHSGRRTYAFFPSWNTLTPDNILWTSCLDLNSSANYFLSCWIKELNLQYPYSIEVYIHSEPTLTGATFISAPSLPIDTSYVPLYAPFTVPQNGTYYAGLRAVSSNNALGLFIDDLHIDINTGITIEAREENIFLFPNPSSEILRVTGTKKNEEIILYDLLGEVVMQNVAMISFAEISISQLPAGIYTVAVGDHYRKRFVKVD